MNQPLRTVIACGSVKAELEKNRPAENGIDVHYMPQNLHRTPGKLRENLQQTLGKLQTNNPVILGYGLCCNGVVGLTAPKGGLFIPKVHDCIALYLGSIEKYREIFSKNPGTYHLTQNWIDNEKDPIGLVENEYSEAVGQEEAMEAMEYEIQNYSHISFINTGTGNTEYYKKRAKENAQTFNKEFIEYKGSNDFFRMILFGPWNKENFVRLKANEISRQKHFL